MDARCGQFLFFLHTFHIRSSLIVVYVLLRLVLQHGDDHDDDQQEHNDRGTYALIIIYEGLLVEQVYQRLGLIESRVVLIHDHEDQVEHLQAADHPGDRHEEDRGGQQRDRDMEELVDPIGAVDAGCLIVILGDILQAGKEKDHVVA